MLCVDTSNTGVEASLMKQVHMYAIASKRTYRHRSTRQKVSLITYFVSIKLVTS